MRILQLVHKPQRRGAEIFARQLSAELRRQGHEAALCYLYPAESEGAWPLESGELLLEGEERHLFERMPGFHPSLLRRVLRVIRTLRPDVVQLNGARTVKYGALARAVDHDGGWVAVYRNIGTPRDWLRTPYHRAFYRNVVVPKLDGIVALTSQILDDLHAAYDVSVPTCAIPRGIDPSALEPRRPRAEVRAELGASAEDRVLLCVASLSREKRVDRFLRIVASVRRDRPFVQAWIVGDGPERPRLEALAKKLELGAAVRFLGVQKDVGTWMNGADLFVLTSDTEGVPGAVLEAGYLGLAVVATDVGGLCTCVEDGRTGLLVSKEDEGVFAGAVLALIDDDARRAAFGRAAKAFVEERFLITSVAERYVGFFSEVLDSRRALLRRTA